MRKPVITESRLVHENTRQQIFEVHADFATGAKVYYRNQHNARAGLVVAHEGRILMTHQYRLLTDDVSIEIPGGKIDDGETAAEAALRETLEETGIRCADARMLVDYLPGMDCIDNPTKVLSARFVEDTGTFRADDMEVFKCDWYPFADCLDMIFTGRIKCALTIIGVLAFLQSADYKDSVA